MHDDEQQFEDAVRRLLTPVYRFVLQYVGNESDAEDVTQETFVKAWRKRASFDAAKNFRTWIFSIAKNTALDFLKKKRAIPFSYFDDTEGGNFIIDTLRDPAPLPPELLERKGLSTVLSAALQRLSPSSRVVLLLHYNDHLTFREMAEVFGEPLHTVKSRHRRAIIALRKLLM